MSIVVPSFQEVLHLIPPGINPYTVVMESIDKIVFPAIPKSTYVLLIVFGTGNLFTLFACLAVILVPFQRSRHFQKKHVWFFRAQYIDGRCPLYVPNAGLVVAITQAYDVCWLPGYLGFYLTAISALYTWSVLRRFTLSTLELDQSSLSRP
ncbi:hypothetical protein CROQUDRAFT_87950 [Cronartium quercuum f. sp. fusiforme G11]|uniref:Uncharacterized protein n=1 Tax=Cronartium quercuum f. sp. fusiforme G11 TaxID=708437 RepID=A0A9P6NRR2_9BASI|nr:hypothetical protein CROQUDRAFT_87950 [Cronartium quercuum f. sp. fusiforme G11]